LKLSSLVRIEAVIPDLHAADKDSAIRTVAAALEGDPRVNDPEALVQGIFAREAMESTGLGNLAALPHARTDAVDDIVMAIGRSREGIAYGPKGEEPVRLIFCMGTPKRMVQEYLRAVASLARLLKQEAFRNAILQAGSAQDILDALDRFQS
jgi:mannitol/fructose-specific phosphotransferase system IIA component (Ntr-type)